MSSLEWCHLLVNISKTELMVHGFEDYLRKETDSHYLVEQLIDSLYGIYIIDYEFVQSTIVNTYIVSTIFLADEQHCRTSVKNDGFDEGCIYKFFQFI